jgi:hypothetical protein
MHTMTVGTRYGRLVVTGFVPPSTRPRRWKAICTCDCGKVGHVSRFDQLRNGEAQSCGCLQHERTTKHGFWAHPLYHVWRNMMKRCHDPRNKAWEHYGKRGITVCQSWRDIRNFIADMGPSYQEGLQIDRIDTNGDYEPPNCRWATRKEQGRNKRNNVILEHNGERMPFSAWAERMNLSEATIRRRLEYGWDISRALTTPPGPNNGKRR